MILKDITAGIYSYITAINLISKLKLWKYFFIPAIIGFIVGLSIFWGAYLMSDNLGDKIASIWPWEWLSETINKVSHWVGGFVLVIFGLIAYKHIVQAFSSPFMGPLSEKIETHFTGQNITSNSFIKLLIRGIRINIRNLIKELLITLPLMLFSLIPVIGLVASLLIFYFQAYYSGYGNMDYTMERYFNYKKSITFVKQHRGVAVGNGILFNFMLFIPFVGIMLTLPISTVAATVQTLKKLELDKKVQLINSSSTHPKQ